VKLGQCAASVLCTIVSKPAKNVYTVDGGTKTFAGDVYPDAGPLFLNGYGKVVEDNNMVLRWMNEEHGIIEAEGGAKEFEIGDKIRIIPNHICTVVNLFDEMIVFRNDLVEGKWKIAARGKRT
jgi:D-serine deaminase-like pyridoxal phosphate-dependent protein